MSDELNGFLNEQSQEAPQVEERQVQEAPEQENQEPEAHGEPTSPSTDKHVPLAALEAERKGRQDWKEKAIRYEEELKQVRQNQPQHTEQREPVDPLRVMESRIQDMNLNFSERMARKEYGEEVVNEAFEAFKQAVEKNPLLHREAMANPDPWGFVVQKGKEMKLLAEVGSDPAAYREKVRAEMEAEILEKHGLSKPSQAAPAAKIPASLAGARSSAGRSAAVFTGPPGLDDILDMK